MVDSNRPTQANRLRDLQHPETCHSWLWALGARKREALPRKEFILSVRMRLCATVTDDDVTCSYCRSGTLDAHDHDSLICAGAEAPIASGRKIKFYFFCQSDISDGNDVDQARAAGDSVMKEVQDALSAWADEQLAD